jgi:uncharacterized surface anchored protein
MAANKALAALSMAMLLFAGMPAIARASEQGIEETDLEVEVTGQVTITNVDESDNTVKLNGATVKIVDKATSMEFTDIIETNGTLVYELPLGDYSLIQLTPPDGYELNTRVYDFDLQIPEGMNQNSISVVNRAVMITNRTVGTATEPPAYTDPPRATSVPDAQPEETPPPAVIKNPETADFSIFYIIAAFLCMTGLAYSAIRMSKAKKRQR